MAILCSPLLQLLLLTLLCLKLLLATKQWKRGLGLHVVASENRDTLHEARETESAKTQVMLVATEWAWPLASDNLLNQPKGTRKPKKEGIYVSEKMRGLKYT